MDKQAGETGLRVLVGEHPQDEVARSDFLFDWRQLQRWQIPARSLATGSILVNRQPTLWEPYRNYVIAVIVLFLLPAIVLVRLFWRRARKKQLQRSLVDQIRSEKILSGCPGKFAGLREEPIGLASGGYIRSGVDITDRQNSDESAHALMGRLISAQDEERARIAKELHDDFSQRLALLGIGLGQLWKKLSTNEAEERVSILQMLDWTNEMSSDLHILSHQLHSSKLEHIGLAPTLSGLCREIGQKYDIEIDFTQCACPRHLPKDVALCLFRVTQDALSNVVKHSGSNHAEVDLSAEAGVLMLRVSDRGKGFDPKLPKSSTGIGIIAMGERLHLIGGKLSVDSEPNTGTEILAEVPLASVDEKQINAQLAGR